MNLSCQLRGLGVCVGVGDSDQDDEANPDRGHGPTVDADGRSAYSLHEGSHRTTLSSQAPSPAGGAAVLIVALPPVLSARRVRRVRARSAISAAISATGAR